MSVTTPPTVDALPTAPSTSAPTLFNALMDALLAALAGFVTQCNAISTNLYNNAVDAYNSAVAAASSASSASSSASAASAISGAAAWVYPHTYTINQVAISQLNFQTYRHTTASSGVNTDPRDDPTNWTVLTQLKTWL